MNQFMKKGKDYAILENAGLPIPIYGVFDASCLTTKRADLCRCVDRIMTDGSHLAGVRTEPKDDSSPLGNYPHYMPLRNLQEVIEAVQRHERENPNMRWWYLVNEAFLEYEWNAVLRLTRDGSLPGYWMLDGEVNLRDNLPLRPSLDDTKNVTRACDWTGSDPAAIRKLILQAALFETFLEISKVKTSKGSRLIFWGRRGVSPTR